jgi:hypothetical protein
MVQRLAIDPEDADAVIVIFQDHGSSITGAAIRWFGRGGRLYKKVVFDILAALAREAPMYDPELMDAVEWVRRRSDTEAKRLRELWDGRPIDCLTCEEK